MTVKINPKYGAITRVSGKIDRPGKYIMTSHDVFIEVRVYKKLENNALEWITDWIKLDNVHSLFVHINTDDFVMADMEVYLSEIDNIVGKIDEFIITPEPKKIR